MRRRPRLNGSRARAETSLDGCTPGRNAGGDVRGESVDGAPRGHAPHRAVRAFFLLSVSLGAASRSFGSTSYDSRILFCSSRGSVNVEHADIPNTSGQTRGLTSYSPYPPSLVLKNSQNSTSIGHNPFTETIYFRKYSVYEGFLGENTRLRESRRRRDFGRFWAILGDFGRFWAILGDFG